MAKKAMTMPLNVLVAIIVLLVLALILITLVSNNVLKFSANSGDSIDSSSKSVQCQTEIATYCATHVSGESCSECSSCTGTVECP